MKIFKILIQSWILRILMIAGLSCSLSACDNANVYGSVSVGSSWGGYGGSPYGRTTIGVSGRIR